MKYQLKSSMAITFFQLPGDSVSNDLPFFNEWKSSTRYREDSFEITELVRVKSNKGYLCKTTEFLLFLWNNSSVTKQLIEALDYYVQKGTGVAIVAVVNSSFKDGYALGIDSDEEVIWYNVGGKFTTSPEPHIIGSSASTVNPFISPSPLTPFTKADLSAANTRKRRNPTQTPPQ